MDVLVVGLQRGEPAECLGGRLGAAAANLLGVGGGNLIASGRRLWWLNVDTGKVAYYWPDRAVANSYGRGALVGDEVLFPTRTDLHVFRQDVGNLGANGAAALVEGQQVILENLHGVETDSGGCLEFFPQCAAE